MDGNFTTQAVQNYLDELRDVGSEPSEAMIRALLARAAERIHVLCAGLLFRSYPRLMRGPLNLQSEELLSAVVERLMKALREVRPENVRQFFALTNQHMRWELNDLARRLDEKGWDLPLRESFAQNALAVEPSRASPNLTRILEVIESLPEDEREAFNLIRIQGMSRPEAAAIAGVSIKTIHRRVQRCVLLLSEKLGDLNGEGRSTVLD